MMPLAAALVVPFEVTALAAMVSVQKKKPGRYDLAQARDVGQRGTGPRHAQRVRNIEVATAAVPDPWRSPDDPPHQRVLAAVNRKVDILEVEHGHGRISAAAYGEGRIAQMLFERAGLSCGSFASFGGSRVDAVVAKELAILRRLDDARIIAGLVKELEAVLGTIDAKILREVLGENRTYAQVGQTVLLQQAAARGGAYDWVPYGKGGKRAPAKKEVAARRVNYIAQRFRDALETLAKGRRGR